MEFLGDEAHFHPESREVNRVAAALGLRKATPAEVSAGYWDSCPYCSHAVYLPIAGGKESKAPVRCPACAAAIRPDC